MSAGRSNQRGVRLPRQERRAQLLGAAQEAFVRNGYHAAAMDEIAERAGVSKPVLYQHFPGKAELYLALLDQALGDIYAGLVAALDGSPAGREQVLATIDAYFAFVDSRGGAYRLVFESDMTNDPQARARIVSAERAYSQEIARVLRTESQLDQDESAMLASGVVGLAQSSARAWLADGRRVSRAHAVELVTRLAWKGIRGYPRRGDEAASPGPA